MTRKSTTRSASLADQVRPDGDILPSPQLLKLLEEVQDAVLLLDNGRVVYADPTAKALLGNSILNEQFEDLVHQDDRHLAAELMGPESGPRVLRMAGPDGSWRWWRVLPGPVPEKGCTLLRLLLQPMLEQETTDPDERRLRLAEEVNQVLHEEIRKHRATQEELSHAKRFARSLVDSSLDMIMAADTEGRISEFNPAASIRFGYDPLDIIGGYPGMLYAHQDEYLRVQRELDLHGAFAGEIRNVTREGEEFVSFLAASRLYDDAGEYLGVMGVSRDITQAKRDREQLEASEERYRDLFENATDLIQITDPEGIIRFVNSAWKKALGRTVDEGELRVADIVLPARREAFLAVLNKALEGGGVQHVDTVFQRPDGSKITVEGTISLRSVEGRPDSLRCILRDVTHIREVRERVLEHEAKMRALYESSEHMFWTVDPAIKLTSFNRGYSLMIERLHGQQPQIDRDPDTPRKRFADPEHHAFWEAKYAEAFAGEQVRFETDLRDTEGRRVCNEVFLSPVFDAECGHVKEVFGIGHEITEQKRARELLRNQAARLEAIFQNAANMMLWTLDSGLHLTSFNGHFGSTMEQALGRQLAVGDHFISELQEHMTSSARGAMRSRYTEVLKGRPYRFELELSDTRGEAMWLELFLDPILIDGRVEEISCLAHVITEKKEAEQRLLASLHEKDVLLREVHHRVKNNLQVIISILNLQTAHVGGDPALLALLRDSMDRIRAMAFIHETLYQTKDFGSLDLGSYIGDLAHNLVMNYRLSEHVALEADLVRVDLGLEQAIPCGLILNELIGNALKHAFGPGDAGRIRLGLKLMDGQVQISVSDDGKGLPADFDDMEQAGLGLQLVHSLVEQLDGRLERKGARGVSYLLTFEHIK